METRWDHEKEEKDYHRGGVGEEKAPTLFSFLSLHHCAVDGSDPDVYPLLSFFGEASFNPLLDTGEVVLLFLHLHFHVEVVHLEEGKGGRSG